ncbi:sigma-70 family RNA polymerase sigma factor [Enemella sp. A6]|uniref:sigma-70 family RNA polymerase sigma factor n=1 Tax=Enemella sp. A6 TaxID=3440152 RepID=UPI003EBE533D
MDLYEDLDRRIFADLCCDNPSARLTAEQEAHLARTIEVGTLAVDASAEVLDETERRILIARGLVAHQRMILANLPLVSWVVAQEWRSDEREDQFQEGVLGLDRAVRGYDHRRGGFGTYAIKWIREAVFGARAHQVGRGARWMREWHRLRGLEDSLTQEYGRTVDAGDLAEAAGQSSDWIHDRLQRPGPLLGLEPELADSAVEPEQMALPAEEVTAMLDRLARLPRRVLELRFGIGRRPHSRVEIARTLGLSTKQVAGIEERALEELRGVCPSQLGEYLAA